MSNDFVFRIVKQRLPEFIDIWMKVTQIYFSLFTEPTKITSLTVVDSAEDIVRNTANKTLVCQARTDPRTNLYVEWFVNDTKISNENDRSLEVKNSICNFKSAKNELFISCLDVNIPMEIVCKASNRISISKKSYKINVSLPSSATSKEENFFLEGFCVLLFIIVKAGDDQHNNFFRRHLDKIHSVCSRGWHRASCDFCYRLCHSQKSSQS